MSKFRGLVTSGTGFTFLVVGVTGVIFQFWFKNRPLLAIHAWLGVAMFIVALVHILQNWRSFLRHLRDWRVYAILLPLLGGLGYYSLSTHGEGRRGFAGRDGNNRDDFRRGAGNFGNGNRPQNWRNPAPSTDLAAKLSVAHADTLATALGKNPDIILASMKKDGFQVTASTETLADLASQNRRTPDEVLQYFIR